jgi:hypothetical protein
LFLGIPNSQQGGQWSCSNCGVSHLVSFNFLGAIGIDDVGIGEALVYLFQFFPFALLIESKPGKFFIILLDDFSSLLVIATSFKDHTGIILTRKSKGHEIRAVYLLTCWLAM